MVAGYVHRVLVLCAMLVMCVGGITACSRKNDGVGASPHDDGATLALVATTTQICDYVTQIANNPLISDTLSFEKTDASGATTHYGADPDNTEAGIALTCLLSPNASAHEHEMTPGQMKALKNADIFLINGVDLEHFLDQAVESSGFHGTMLVTSGVYSSKNDSDASINETPYVIDEGDDAVDVAPWPFAPQEGEEAEFLYDPHVWTSPRNAAIQIRAIGQGMAAAARAQGKDRLSDGIEQSTASFEQAMSDLDMWISSSLSSIPQEHRVLFTSHDAFGYFAKDYGVTFIGSALSDFSGQQDATASHIQNAVDEIKKSGAVALFAENSNNSASIEKIAQLAGVKAIIGDDALYGDSLGPVGSEGETYVGSIVHNVTTLCEAWGGNIAQYPDTLDAYLSSTQSHSTAKDTL